MNRADELAAKAQRLADKRKAAQAGNAEQPVRPSVPAVRVKRVRRTVDLYAAQHAELDMWCTETARELGRARVTGQAVMEALVRRLLTDETLARKIRADLADG